MKRCCICGEPVVNNRCVRCGMIMFDDAGVRYHLNESGREHEAHQPGTRVFSVYESGSSVSSVGKKKKRVKPTPTGTSRADAQTSLGERKKNGKLLFLAVVVIFLIAFLPPLTEYVTSELGVFYSSKADLMLERDGYLTFEEGRYKSGRHIPEGTYAVYSQGERMQLVISDESGNILEDLALQAYEKAPGNVAVDPGVELAVTGEGGLEFYPLTE